PDEVMYVMRDGPPKAVATSIRFTYSPLTTGRAAARPLTVRSIDANAVSTVVPGCKFNTVVADDAAEVPVSGPVWVGTGGPIGPPAVTVTVVPTGMFDACPTPGTPVPWLGGRHISRFPAC